MHTCEPPAVCAVSTHPSKQHQQVHQQVQMMRDGSKLDGVLTIAAY